MGLAAGKSGAPLSHLAHHTRVSAALILGGAERCVAIGRHATSGKLLPADLCRELVRNLRQPPKNCTPQPIPAERSRENANRVPIANRVTGVLIR
jgi:hypothetical protein